MKSWVTKSVINIFFLKCLISGKNISRMSSVPQVFPAPPRVSGFVICELRPKLR